MEGRFRDYPAGPACTGIKGERRNLALALRAYLWLAPHRPTCYSQKANIPHIECTVTVILGSWWGLARVPILALLFGVRIGIEEQTLRRGLEGYDDYARRVRRCLIPFIW